MIRIDILNSIFDIQNPIFHFNSVKFYFILFYFH